MDDISGDVGIGDGAYLGTGKRRRGLAPTTARLAWITATGLFVLALPLAIILGTVRFAFSWQPVYTYAVAAYHADEVTGITRPRLLIATGAIRNYFSNEQRDLDISVLDGRGQFVALFSAREIAHMRDVKALVRRLYLLLDVAVAYVVVYGAVTLWSRAGGSRRLAKAALAGALLTDALILVLGGAAALGGFDRMFLDFHQLSFSNDFWQLDPARDRLVQIFPQGFWLDVTMFVGFLAFLAAAILAGVSASYLLLTRPRPRA
jgi:integral membrane protein (TIGR01906 family)